ncbi:MAG TPA: autotransporter-associated beta strand repeat-containing protein [Bacteroidales bacterium]|nr:autotransporter-associated beta strand repeat-containing protein [Bacteroidales bacterium]HQB70756.1 autotransporter-associated beta strand repeat-containing protein [Bacteroidales bacterium]
MKKFLLFLCLSVVAVMFSYGQRLMENLDRGLTAVKVSNGVFVSWRMLGSEWNNTQYNLYRNGVKLNTEPLSVSNYLDEGGSNASTYTLGLVKEGVESPEPGNYAVWNKQYLEIPMRQIIKNGIDYGPLYELNDATAADLDGDGQYEIIVKRINSDFSVANDSAFSYFEAYKLDGTLLWAIDIGPNLLSSGHVETNIAAFDWDEDGKAEVIMRAADGTIDGKGNVIGSPTANYRPYISQSANMQFMTQGPEFLCLFDGETGELLDKVDYIARGNVNDWGDNYGHRANKFFFGAPYLDGRRPSILTTRGIYTRIVMRAYDVVDKKLQKRWLSDFDTNNSLWSAYAYQGNHNYTIADVDGDGRDEIVYGSMTVDDNGRGLYSTGYGHGDAMHVSDFDPYHRGLEIFACLEASPHWGAAFRDGATTETFIKHVRGADCGRCMAANVTDDYPGAELWADGKMWSATTRELVGSSGGTQNFAIYWDGDLLRETFDYTNLNDVTGGYGYGTPAVFKYNKGSVSNIFTATGTATNNYTKGNPCLQADLFGDWREEMVLRSTDNKYLRIYTSVVPSPWPIYTLMHDHQYRQAICWQMCGYNQPPHTSFFLGEREGITAPPPPWISNGKTEIDGFIGSDHQGQELMLANTSGAEVELKGQVSPASVQVNSPGDYRLYGTGELQGPMTLHKQGLGNLTIEGAQTYSGNTEVWDGLLTLKGSLAGPLLLRRFAELDAYNSLEGGLQMEYGAILRPGGSGKQSALRLKSIKMDKGAVVEFNLSDADFACDTLLIQENLELSEGAVFRFVKPTPDSKPQPGDYLFAVCEGTVSAGLSKIVIEGLPGVACSVLNQNDSLFLHVDEQRAAQLVYWHGKFDQGIWNLNNTRNFYTGQDTVEFVTNDTVVFDQNTSSRAVNITEEVIPSEVRIQGDLNYAITGNGGIGGSSSLIKEGQGKLSLLNTNPYTGKTLIKGGTVEVSSLATSQGAGSLGALSSVSNNLTIQNGAILKTTGNISMESPMYLGPEGGCLDISNTLTMKGVISGSTLIKRGNGTLEVTAVNTHRKTILEAGTLKVLEEPNLINGYFGDTLVLNGGVVICLDGNSSYSRANWNIVVPAGKSATIYLDGRCEYHGSLHGSGTLTLSAPYVRNYLCGNWSAFEGVVKATTKANSSYTPSFDFKNTYGLPKATLDVAAGTTVTNQSGSFKLGAVSGNGTLGGSNAWEIGYLNTTNSFSGTITSALTKVGTGTLLLSGANNYTGDTNINGGILRVNNANNATVSATGTGRLNINNGGTLTGRGFIDNNIVYINSGGLFIPGAYYVGELKVDGSIYQNPGGVLEFRLNSATSHSSIKGLNVMTLKGTLRILLKEGYTPSLGDSFELWSCNSFSSSIPELVLPELPANLAWDTSELFTGRGKLSVTDANGLRLNSWDEVLDIQVVNINGLTVADLKSKATEWEKDIKELNLAKGIYLIKLQSGKSSRIVKHYQP